MPLHPPPPSRHNFYSSHDCKRKKRRNLFMVICLLRLDNSFLHNCRLRTTRKPKRISFTFSINADCFISYRLFVVVVVIVIALFSHLLLYSIFCLWWWINSLFFGFSRIHYCVYICLQMTSYLMQCFSTAGTGTWRPT